VAFRSLFIILSVRLCLTDCEAKPRALSIKYGAGKPQAFRTESGKAAKIEFSQLYQEGKIVNKMSEGTLLLRRGQVSTLLTIDECIDAVELAFKSFAQGKTANPGILGIHSTSGGFHIKAAIMELPRRYFVSKINANFPENPHRFQLPTIQGVIVLFDAENGRPLAVMDSMEITVIRTGAATAVAAKYLARADAKIITICGCGNQGEISLRAVNRVRNLERAFAFDKDSGKAENFSQRLSTELPFEVLPVKDLRAAVRESDICVTGTPSKRFFIKREFVSPGAFIAAVGADNEEKQEIDPTLMAAARVVVDHLQQCLTIGDLHHAVVQGLMTGKDVLAELGEVIAGLKPGRQSDNEILIFDSTGTALQDVAAAGIVYERAVRNCIGTVVDFSR